MSKKIIPFNKPPYLGTEKKYVLEAISDGHISGNGYFCSIVEQWITKKINTKDSLFVPSCTHALEMTALILNIQQGDEVIMPSFTFVSTASAFSLRGAKIVYVDVDPVTMNIDPNKISEAINSKTKAVVVVHYAGFSNDVERIRNLCDENSIPLIEDAAQAIMSKRGDKYLGSFGHMATFSFHETKNCTSGGEGGALLINDEKYIEDAHIIRDKGTNRRQFHRGQVDKYSWIRDGSSYLATELQAAFLYAQLEGIEILTEYRRDIWNRYYEHLEDIKLDNSEFQLIENSDNAHLFFIKCSEINERQKLIDHLKNKGIMAVFHYVPLHSSKRGSQVGCFHGKDEYTTSHSERLLRLPLWYGLNDTDVRYICNEIKSFYAR